MPFKPARLRTLVPSYALTVPTILMSGMLGVGCGGEDKVRSYDKPAATETEANATAEENNQEEQPFDELALPPQEYYDTLFAEALRTADSQSLALADADQVLYVNFNGATVSKGFGRGQSFILCRQSATIPSAGLSPADQQAILAEVQRFYNEAGARLIVTAEKPSAGDYTTIHTGGSYRDFGCIGGGVLGVAPFDRGNANRNDVGFAFTSGVSSNRVIAETIAHEAAHSFGLDHVESRKDIMFASSTSQITGFTVSRISGSARTQDAPAVLKSVLGTGTSTAPVVAGNSGNNTTPSPASPVTPVPAAAAIPGIGNLPGVLANLPGLTQIGNLGQLIPGLAQGGNFDISGLLAQALAVIPSGAGIGNLPQFDKILAAIGLSAQAGANQNPGAGLNPAGGLAGLAGSILGNANLGGLASIASLAGLGNIGTAVGAAQTVISTISGLSGGAVQGGLPALPAGLPDLSALLGLVGQNTSPADIINNLAASAGVINGNFSGAQKDALLSLIKVGYSQAFNQVSGSGGK